MQKKKIKLVKKSIKDVKPKAGKRRPSEKNNDKEGGSAESR